MSHTHRDGDHTHGPGGEVLKTPADIARMEADRAKQIADEAERHAKKIASLQDDIAMRVKWLEETVNKTTDACMKFGGDYDTDVEGRLAALGRELQQRVAGLQDARIALWVAQWGGDVWSIARGRAE